jgi:uncharacterized membrane protein
MRDRFTSGRLEAFSDGVFAIAATLLVLEISVPESGFDDLWQAIRDEWPSYLAYTTSFFTIGGLWAAHHGLFRRLETVDVALLRLNLLLLWGVAFLPFPTMLTAEALQHESDAPERTAVLFYGGALLFISCVITVMTVYAARHRELLREGVTDAELRWLTARLRPTPGFYGAILILALLAPRGAVWMFLVVSLLSALVPEGPRRDRRHRQADTPAG